MSRTSFWRCSQRASSCISHVYRDLRQNSKLSLFGLTLFQRTHQMEAHESWLPDFFLLLLITRNSFAAFTEHVAERWNGTVASLLVNSTWDLQERVLKYHNRTTQRVYQNTPFVVRYGTSYSTQRFDRIAWRSFIASLLEARSGNWYSLCLSQFLSNEQYPRFRRK